MPADKERLSCVEFFSGIGAFAEAARQRQLIVKAAFDQNSAANDAYEHNFDLRPSVRNLDSIAASDIPPADLWWMSPPCTPFTVRGKQRDDQDPRAASFLNMIARLEESRPTHVLIENVSGFVNSVVHQTLIEALKRHDYEVFEVDTCPTEFGVPMRRPRHFVIASRSRLPRMEARSILPLKALRDYLKDDFDEELTVDDETMSRYGKSFDIVERAAADKTLTCFTRGYFKCRKASGSFIAMPDGKVRRVSPAEILLLLGFSKEYEFPKALDKPTCWRLAGNSVCVRSIHYLLDIVLQSQPKGAAAS